jgi:hypothetical protein
MGPRHSLTYCMQASAAPHRMDVRTARNVLENVVHNARKLASTDQEIRAVEWVEAVANLTIQMHEKWEQQ